MQGFLRSKRVRDRRTPEELQHEFYSSTAGQYDAEMVGADDEHFVALRFISTMIDGLGYDSVLDVGSGTGRGVKHLIDRHAGIEVRGVEPVRAMIDKAEKRNDVPASSIVEASGYSLPFEPQSFDVVCELGVLHHVKDPNAVVKEMMRVARRAIFLSDENRFGNGRWLWRRLKYGLVRAGLWPLIYRLAHRGRPYHLSDVDGGVLYSYSVYDSMALLNEWADRIFFVPTVPAKTTWFHPLFGARNVLLCAVRD